MTGRTKRKGSFATAVLAFILFSLSACGAKEADVDYRDRKTEGEEASVQSKQEEDRLQESESGTDEESGDGRRDGGQTDGIISGEGILPGRKNYHLDSFGENVWFFAPEDDPEAVQKELEILWGRQETNQFGDARYSVYFLPGEYDDRIRPKVGFYMQVAGLGETPDAVSLYTVGCDARWLGGNDNHNATCNFWRGVENLSARDYVTWAVSQATFMRRVHLEKTMYLHDSNGWCSGGFLSNSKIELAVNSGSQQQWLSRNCDWNTWIGENWNMVFAGIREGKTPEGSWPEHAYTDVPVVEEIREKPFLAYDVEKGFGVYLPALRREAVGADWTPGEFLPIEDFYIARPFADTAETINKALNEGKHLLLTPGVYQLTEPIVIAGEGTIVLGTGLATLRSMEGNACIEVTGGTKVTLAGILFDAGPKETEHLLMVGREPEVPEASGSPQTSDSFRTRRTLLADLFFRVGGAKGYDTNVKCCVKLHQDGIISDNFWVWRADHGSGVGWEKNRAANGRGGQGRGKRQSGRAGGNGGKRQYLGGAGRRGVRKHLFDGAGGKDCGRKRKRGSAAGSEPWRLADSGELDVSGERQRQAMGELGYAEASGKPVYGRAGTDYFEHLSGKLDYGGRYPDYFGEGVQRGESAVLVPEFHEG